MAKKWFKRTGFLFYPITWQGILITVLAIVFCAKIFTVISRDAHSAARLLYGIYPYWVTTALAWMWIAEKTSSKD